MKNMQREVPKHLNERKKKKKPTKSDHKHDFFMTESEIVLKLGGADPLCVVKISKRCKVCDKEIEAQKVMSESKYIKLIAKLSD